MTRYHFRDNEAIYKYIARERVVAYTVNVIEALIVIGGAIGITAVGLFVSGLITRWWSSALYALLIISLGLLVVACFNALILESHPVANLWYARLGVSAVVVALACLYFLVQELAEPGERTVLDRGIDWAIAASGAILLCLAFTPAILTDSGQINAQTDPTLTSSWGVVLFILYSSSIAVLVAYRLIRRARQAYNRRYGVLDARFIIVRMISYILTLATVTAIFFITAYVGSLVYRGDAMYKVDLFGPIAVVAALFAAFSLQPVRHFFNKVTDALFYKDNYSIDDFVVTINQILNSTNDLRTLLERVSESIAKTLKSKQALFYVPLPEGHYMIAGTHGHSRIAPAEFSDISINRSDHSTVLMRWQFDKTHPIHRMMASHRLGLVLQLTKGEAIIGYLCLGSSLRSGFTTRDIKVLRTIADELAIAIQNAVSVDEVKKLNDTLEQRVNAATKELRTSNSQLQRLDEAKDEFVSMASHQLRTPLTSVKGYISMLIEGDAGPLNKEQKQFLNEAFVSSERMVRLIGDFLNVSRLQTGRFTIERHPVDLGLLVQREIEGLAQNAAARGVKFSFKRPKSLPILELDENKIQQVVMNFSDNAIYYSKEKSKVTILLQKVPGYIEFKVVDTGIGVPKAEQTQLFSKFYRASNARQARPDGTGVGLFLAKKVIDDHGGTIIFESHEGKGSTFGFRLPAPD